MSRNIKEYERTGIYQRAIKGRLDYLSEKAKSIPKDQALALGLKNFQDNFEGNQEAALQHFIDHFEEDYVAFVDRVATCDTVDSESDDDDTYYSNDDGNKLASLFK